MKLFIQLVFFFLFSCNLVGQDFDLLGVIDDQLVKINSSTNAIEVVGNLNPAPTELVRFLTFVEEECLFYGVMDGSNNPTLISIDLDLNFTEIGRMTLPGGSLYFCEALSFNTTNNTLYAGVSIDGSIAGGDYFSEVIVEVNRLSAQCQFTTEIIGNVSDPDIDRMSFCGNTLYFHDGTPGQWSKFLELEFIGLGATEQATELLSVGYVPTKDLECTNGNVYYSTGRDLSFFSPGSNSITNLGDLFSTTSFGGEEITGLSINPFPDYLGLGDDISLCGGSEYLLELDYPYANVTWNNGSTGNSILITETGTFWADVIYNSCSFRTDSIDVTFDLTLNISLGPDFVVCDGESINLTIDEPNIDVVWSDGTIGAEIEINESGSYWAEFMFNDCEHSTDTIDVLVIEPLELPIGADTNICQGETLTLIINQPNIDVLWNDGTTGNELSIDESGFYWAEYTLDDCIFSTDTIYVEVVEMDIELISNITLCSGDSYIVSLEGVGQNINWNNGYTGNQLIITEPGLYWAEVLLGNCDIGTDTIEAFFIEEIDFSILSDTVICQGESIFYSINDPNVNVIWSDGTINNEITISEEGYYWAEYNIEGCMFFTDTIYVEVVDDEFDIGSDISICEGDTYILELNGIGGNVIWNNGQIGNQLVISETGEYWAEIDLGNCQFSTNTVIANIIPNQTIEIGVDTLLCGEEELLLTASTETLEVLWSTGEFGNSILVNEEGSFWAIALGQECFENSDTIEVRFIEDPNLMYDFDTVLCIDEVLEFTTLPYDVSWSDNEGQELTSITETGIYLGSYQIDQCLFETDSLKVQFVDCTPCEYYIPNIISPNSDKINDNFAVVFPNSCDVLNFEIFIFDRWGNLVLNSNENFWNGEFNFKPVENGVYVYHINMNIGSNVGDAQEVSISGDLTVLK